VHFEIGWDRGHRLVRDFVAGQQIEIGLFDRLAQLFLGAVPLHHVGSPAELRQLLIGAGTDHLNRYAPAFQVGNQTVAGKQVASLYKINTSRQLQVTVNGQIVDPASVGNALPWSRAVTFTVTHDVPNNDGFRGMLLDAQDE